MRSRNRQRSSSHILPVLIVFGILAGIVFAFQGALIRTKLDGLMSRVLPLPASEMDAPPVGSPDPTIIVEESSETADPALSLIDDEALAPDGFPVKARRHVLKYTVQSGDTLFGIADRFGLTPDTIFWANTETLQDDINLLFVGIHLYILPVDGVYYRSDGSQTIAEIAAQYAVAPGDILYSEFNDLSREDSSYTPPEGLHLVIPGGRRAYISWQSPIHTGTASGSANPEGEIHPGSCRQLYTGTGGQGDFANPLGATPYRTTNGFAAWHPGVDLAADYGMPIYASETGVVVFAGWHRDGYGELIIIDHGDGWTTYYGHLSKRFVGCGDQVVKGQYIGQMGMSGNATGVHLHFEIRLDDLPQNPFEATDIVRTAP